MAVTCKNCGGAHAIWECKRPAKKSTGSERSGAQAASGRPKIILFDGMGAASDKLPVDTNGKTKDHRDHSGPVLELEGTPVRVQSPPSSPPKFDKKAWSRAYMKIWMRNKRAKLKASPGA